MSAPLCFVDTETSGLHPDRRVWEVAIIRREAGAEQTLVRQVADVDLSHAEPMGLKVGGFYDRHHQYSPPRKWATGLDQLLNAGEEFSLYADRLASVDQGMSVEFDPPLRSEAEVAAEVEQWTRGAHMVGVVPSFDADCLDKMLRRHQLIPAWHYHLVDVEAMAVGWLSARSTRGLADPVAPPWKSDELSRRCGVEPPGEAERHTARGDAEWAMRWYDALTGGGA